MQICIFKLMFNIVYCFTGDDQNPTKELLDLQTAKLRTGQYLLGSCDTCISNFQLRNNNKS